jgi:1-acyl-sn-glycerol-3-phosphate acyltransferase
MRTLTSVLSEWRVEGAEHVPREGPLLIASNHISFWDPPVVGSAVPRETYFLAKEELFGNPAFRWVIRSFNAIPIRRGVGDLRGVARALDVLRRGGALIMFPEGGRMRDGELHPARPGLGMMAVHADAPIVPCYVAGTNHPRRWLTRRARLWLTFGPPRSWREWAGEAAAGPRGRALYQAIGDAVMEQIARLRAQQQLESASRGSAHRRPA